MQTVKVKGINYIVKWDEDTLIPENQRYISDLTAFQFTKKQGWVQVTGENKINLIVDKVYQYHMGRQNDY